MLTLLCLVISTASLILRSLPGSVCIEFSHFGAYTFRKHWMSTERWLHPFSSSSSFLHPLSPLVCLSSSSSSLRSSLSHRLSSDPSLDVRVLDPASLSVLVQSSGSSPRVPAASSPGILPPLWLHRLRHDDPAVAVLALDTSESRSAEDIEAAVFQTVKGLSAGPRRAEGHRGLGAHVVVAVVAKEHEAAEVVSRGTPGKMADERVSVVVVGRRDGHAAGWGKLARVVREKAGWFYSEWIRVLSSWRDSVGAEDQQRRRMQADVRIALLMCFLQEGDAASKYFQQVYQEAEEELHREDEINCKEELKAVLYLCKFFQIKFLIRSGKFAEAVDAFSEHMGRAFKYVGKPETMAFRDLGWIALQYRIMAEFLDSHASPVMNSNRYHNPAYYFHLAAHYMRIRRSAFINSVDLNAGEINLSRAATYDSILESQRYFGNLISFSHSDTENQKPVQSLDSNGLQLEKEINQYLESGFQYTVQIIELLKMAYLHVKQLDSQRFMLFLCQEMAQEYFYSGEWKVALPLLDSILERYRLEKWEFLLVQTLRKTICCSLNLNMTDKAFAYTLEIMSLCKKLVQNLLIFID